MFQEPTNETLIEIGRLCGAWSFLESVSEQTIWGLIGADLEIGSMITDRLDLRLRWELILKHAAKKHTETDVSELRNINKDITTATRDRNIIIHGIMHAMVIKKPTPLQYGEAVQPEDLLNVLRVPCWTIFKGVDAGKNFPVSSKAVETVRVNIQKIGKRTVAFNKRHQYFGKIRPEAPVETGWPTPL